MRNLFKTNNNLVLTLLRLVLGVVFFAHGAQMALGWFGGPGYTGTMNMFTHYMGIPAPFAFLAIMAEFLGGLGLILGLLGRLSAFGIICTMLVAILKVHLPIGFFMNWAGNQKGEGFEYHLLAIALGIAIIVQGSGALSLDLLIWRSLAHGGPAHTAHPRTA